MYKLLLVEDDRFTRELYELLFKQQGYQVETASDGQAGFDLASRGGYDLILLDIMLPKKDGISLLFQLKQLSPPISNQKIVMLTVLNQDKFIKRAMRLGANGYLMKQALKPDEILAEVEVFLSSEN
ncbi:MAG: response regulator [Candidatus Pacebacteria bacterium]|nr:response regulator [Candidatus Paceibacterota bacterium]